MMGYSLTRRALVAAAAFAVSLAGPAAAQTDPLPSWNAGANKSAIVSFVQRTTTAGRDFVPVEARIAVFDNDGTLWSEKPLPFQALFALDQVKTVVAAKPELREQEPYRTVLTGDAAQIAKLSKNDLLTIVGASHAGMTPEEFDAAAKKWLASARDGRTGRPYPSLVYQPQLELLRYLRANGYKTYIVSGGGVDFMRAFAEPIYGIPPEQVIGSSTKARFEQREGRWVLIKTMEDLNVDDKEGKPANIALHIGRRPVIAVGNSDGDLPMLQYAAAGSGPSLEIFVHHDDAAREFAYDRSDSSQSFDKGWDEAVARGWVVVSMKGDWKAVYPPGR